MKTIVMTVFAGCLMTGITSATTYEPEWNSLEQHQTPEWFRDAKFGIYAHWGPATIGTAVGGSGWYGQRMYENTNEKDAKNSDVQTKRTTFDIHREHFGDQHEVGYKDIIALHEVSGFDAAEWADLFEEAGARFAGPVAMHHDNFANWDSKVTRWNVMNYGGVDVTGELAREVRKRGMKLVTSFHHGKTWTFYEGAYQYDGADPQYSDLYCDVHEKGARPNARFQAEWLAKLNEVIDRYEPDLIWFDFGINAQSKETQQQFYADYFNAAERQQREVLVTVKKTSKRYTPDGAAVLDIERGRTDEITEYPWLTDTSLGAWFYREGYDQKKFESNDFVDLLIDIVSKNGCLLLNVPPRPNGSIPENAQVVLKGMGAWLKVNGEAIYNTRPWIHFGEGPTRFDATGDLLGHDKEHQVYTPLDYRFTRSKDEQTIYAISMEWPGERAVIKSLARNVDAVGEISSVELLGHRSKLAWKQTGTGLEITLPADPVGEHAHVFKVVRK